MSRKYKFGEATGAYFISFATVQWIDVFTRDAYFAAIVESLDYCRKNKGMEIYGVLHYAKPYSFNFQVGHRRPFGANQGFQGLHGEKNAEIDC